MSQVGSATTPLRVAIIGAGPAGFYAAEHLFKQNKTIEVDMYDRLPTPYGLVRAGVAPDHQKIKSVTKVFDKVASRPQFRFFGNVELGKHITVAELRRFYHQIVYTTGAQTDRQLGIPGEDLLGSHPATEFVAWYNGHPDYRDLQFDLSQERAAVIGVGNVAVDVARILCRTPEELMKTDIADYALEALRHSRIKEVYMLGRRGPAQTAFTLPEVKELGEMADADALAISAEVALDELSQASLADSADRGTVRKIEVLQEYARRQPSGKSRRLMFRFLVSPVALTGDANNQIVAMKIVKNKLVRSDSGTLQAKAIDEFEELPVGLVFRSIGYKGVPLPGVPFHDKWGVILNQEGRVIDAETKQPVVGEYTAGWIKRGPSGVIGTNKPDAVETADHMMSDLTNGAVLNPEESDKTAVENFLRSRQSHIFSYDDWLKLNALEETRGAEQGRPRLKFTRVADMIEALG